MGCNQHVCVQLHGIMKWVCAANDIIVHAPLMRTLVSLVNVAFGDAAASADKTHTKGILGNAQPITRPFYNSTT
eukprot:736586-Amphidinium_carterae.1